jgi:cyanuric acid amidohydrolase
VCTAPVPQHHRFSLVRGITESLFLDQAGALSPASAGVELLHSEIIVLGNSAAWSGDSVIAHGVVRDAIDLPSAIGVLSTLDITISGQLDEAAASRILALIARHLG